MLNGWIDVDDTLPDEDVAVLVINKDGYMNVATCLKWIHKDKVISVVWKAERTLTTYCGIVAWQPLPGPLFKE